MQLIGHRLIPFNPLYEVKSISQIANTPSQSIVLIPYNDETIVHCQENGVPFALHVKSISQALIANASGALFILVDLKIAKEVQTLADHYLFDSKIAIKIKDEKSLEEIAKLGLDTAIFPKGIIEKID